MKYKDGSRLEGYAIFRSKSMLPAKILSSPDLLLEHDLLQIELVVLQLEIELQELELIELEFTELQLPEQKVK